MDELSQELRLRQIRHGRRQWLRKRYKDKGYKLCGAKLYDDTICNTPIRPKVSFDPSTKHVTGNATGYSVKLTKL